MALATCDIIISAVNTKARFPWSWINGLSGKYQNIGYPNLVLICVKYFLYSQMSRLCCGAATFLTGLGRVKRIEITDEHVGYP